MITQSELILDISKAIKGAVHDFRIFKERKINTQLKQLIGLMKTVIFWGDSAYVAARKYFPHWECRLHEKGKRNHPLTELQKLSNKERSKTRIAVEHVFSRIKKYRCCSERVRNMSAEKQSDYWNIVAGLCNLRRATELDIQSIFDYP